MQKEALANLLGNIGHYYGSLAFKVESFGNIIDIEEKTPKELFATCPSRARYSRGFLWDEGFNLLIIC